MNKLTRRGFLKMSGMSMAGAYALQSWKGTKARRPNIVLIIVDDLGYTDLGCYGAKYYETHNIDTLRAQGIKFSNFYVNAPNCAPSRAALYSGQYPPRTGVYCVGSSERGSAKWRNVVCPRNLGRLSLMKVTMGEALKEAGYKTALFGKWHLGEWHEYHPRQRGFDEGFVLLKPFQYGHWGRRFTTKPETHPEDDVYLGDFLTDSALEFIRCHKNRRQPFFLVLNHFLVHAPLQAPDKLVEKYRKKQPSGGDKNPILAAMIERLDYNVGRMMHGLKRFGLEHNTVVLFTSDNGGVGGYDRLGIHGARCHTSNFPLKGGKTQLYEGGIRVPLIVRWPGVIRPGSQSDVPAGGLDLYPTFLDIADASCPRNYTLDGQSLLAVLKGDDANNWNHRALYWHFPAYCASPDGPSVRDWRSTPQSAIRSGGYKLIEFFHDGHMELYNLAEDLAESHNLVREIPGRAEELHEKLVRWREETGAAVPYRKKGPNTGFPFDSERSNIQTGLSGVGLTMQLARLQYYPGVARCKGGLYVYDVAGNSPAAKAGLQASDIIYKVDAKRINSRADWQDVFGRRKPGDTVRVSFWRYKRRQAEMVLEPFPERGPSDCRGRSIGP